MHIAGARVLARRPCLSGNSRREPPFLNPIPRRRPRRAYTPSSHL